MAGIGIAMAKGTSTGSLINHGVVDIATDCRCTDWHIGRGQLLGKGHHIRGIDTHGGATKIIACAAKAGNHLIGPEHNVVLVEYGLNLLVVTLGRHNNAAGTGDGLGNKGSYGIRPLANNHGFQIVDNAVNKFCLRFLPLFATVIMGMVGAQNTQRVYRQIKMVLGHGQTSQRGCGHGYAMIGALSGNNFATLWITYGFMVVAQ